MNLNIKYDADEKIWDKMPDIYQQLEGWLGFGEGDSMGEVNIPYWFSFNETEKHILASVELAGLHFSGLMDNEEWLTWSKKIKEIATNFLGFKVGEIESGEVEE